MAVERRKDNKNRVLKEGEYQRSSGTYEFKWRDKRGGRHSISAVSLEKLREKELDVLRDVLDGVRQIRIVSRLMIYTIIGYNLREDSRRTHFQIISTCTPCLLSQILEKAELLI